MGGPAAERQAAGLDASFGEPTMRLNTDYALRVIVTPDQYQWSASPQEGVERVMLDRSGGEQARATSIVRYAPRSRFPTHVHHGGEEIFVLTGTFSEDGGHYPAGWYMRNPPGSIHQPFSDEGALIFVKLQQMQVGEDREVRIDTRDPACWQQSEGREVCPLFARDGEQVSLQRLRSAERLLFRVEGGVELLVLAGKVAVDDRPCPVGSWIRLLDGDLPDIVAGAAGATVYLKTGHLARALREERA